MRTAVYTRYGPPEVVQVKEVEKPAFWTKYEPPPKNIRRR